MTKLERPSQESSSADNDKQVLSNRVRMLVDLWELESNKQFTYPQLADFMESRGLPLSRPRWSYLLNGTGHLVSEEAVLTAISDFFGTSSDFLVDLQSEIPPTIVAKLEFLKGLREAQVERFAARALSGVSPETLNEVLSAIRSSREKRTKERDETQGSA
ncbi:hypothetical protein [Leucobacter musarum]|uniref:hypothetical protein n=1 Tax=Leucobacter musarum TaxID=1930747 RepID=UPI0006A7D829|nr:hypothetical protein [Leucobacter musarum]